MDNQNPQAPQAQPQPQQTFGRFDPGVGAVVDDNTKMVHVKGLGWVNARADVYTGGRWFPSGTLHTQAAPLAKEAAQKAALFAQRSAPAADQMRSATAQAINPPQAAPGGLGGGAVPAQPPQPHHKLIADGFKHMANVLTGGK